MSGISIEETLLAIEQHNPVLGAFLNNKTTLLEHSRQLSQHSFRPEHSERQRAYQRILQSQVERIFRNDSKKPKLQYDSNGLIISTADHHGIHNYPPSISAGLVTTLSTVFDRSSLGDMLFLDASKVPLNEVGHRRGLDLHHKHFNLFPKGDKHKLVYNYPKQDILLVEKIKESKATAQFTPEELDFLSEIDAIITSIDYSTCTNFSEQVAKINFALWPLLFDESVRSEVRIPVTLAHDLVLTDYLIEEFFSGKATFENNFVYRAMFDPELLGEVLNEFRGIYGCWEEERNVGTHFFWYVQDGEQYSMWLNGDYLVSYDESGVELVRFPYTAEALAAGLRNKLLVASIFLKFSLIGCWMGVKMLGGPNQIQFSTDIKDGWLNLLSGTEHDLVLAVDTKGLSFMNAIFQEEADGTIGKAYFLDACYSHAIDATYIDRLKGMTIQQSLLPTVDINYAHSVPPYERQQFGFEEKDLSADFSWVKKTLNDT